MKYATFNSNSIANGGNTAISTDLDWPLKSVAVQQGHRMHRHKIHHYDYGQLGTEVFLDTNPPVYYITAQKSGVHVGDYIEIAMPDGHLRLQVSEIEYFSDPADMWMAQLCLIRG